MNPPPSTFAADLAGSSWDIIVIGAGLAGSVTAFLAARAGRRVLLVDAKTFPRDKVCGCCLNERALSLLTAAGLDFLRQQLPGIPLRQIEFVNYARRVVLSAPGGMAVSRRTLDQTLVTAAVEAGAVFRSGCSATLVPLLQHDRPHRAASNGDRDCDERYVRLASTTEETVATAKCVAIADGLNRRSLRDCVGEFPYRIDPHSWIGLGTILSAEDHLIPPGLLRMVIGRAGYVGAVSVDGGRTSLAAALSPGFVRDEQSPGEAIASLFHSAGNELTPAIAAAKWTGTGRLTRTSLKVAGHRTLLIGDAAGYIEPITGEGMTWALSSALQTAPLLARGVDDWSFHLADEWEQRFRQHIRSRQLWCRGLSLALHRPWLVSGCLSVASRFPVLPRLIAASINQPVSRWNPV